MLKNKQIQFINIVLAVLLLLCLLDMPYGYYQLVRFIAMSVFAIYAYHYKENKENILSIIYICLALLFQPFIKITLGRELWNLVDVIVAVWLLYNSLIIYRNIKK